jgi:hypothetical protein
LTVFIKPTVNSTGLSARQIGVMLADKKRVTEIIRTIFFILNLLFYWFQEVNLSPSIIASANWAPRKPIMPDLASGGVSLLLAFRPTLTDGLAFRCSSYYHNSKRNKNPVLNDYHKFSLTVAF